MSIQNTCPSGGDPEMVAANIVAHGRDPLSQLIDDVMRRRAHSRSDGFQKLNLDHHEAWQTIVDSPAEKQIEVVLSAVTRVRGLRNSDWAAALVAASALKRLLRKKLPYRSDDIDQLLASMNREKQAHYMTDLPFLAIVSQLENYSKNHVLTNDQRRRLQQLSDVFHPEASTANARKIGQRIAKLLTPADVRPEAHEGQTETVALCVKFELNTGEAWTKALRSQLERLDEPGQIGWHDLLNHCKLATVSKPSGKWRKKAGLLLQRIGENEFSDVLAPSFSAVGKPGQPERFVEGSYTGYREETVIHQKHIDLLRGLVWATALLSTDQLVAVLGDLADRCFQKISGIGPRCPKIGNAVLTSFAGRPTPAAISQLVRLKTRVKHASVRKQIERALDQASRSIGMSQLDLMEVSVPDHGMQKVGQLRQSFGACFATATFSPKGKATVVWTTQAGKSQKSVPQSVKQEYVEALKSFKTQIKDIEKLIPSIRHRIESLFLLERHWNIEDFRARFLDHPVVGVVARTLIWNFEMAGRKKPAIWHGEQLVDIDDCPIDLHSVDRVLLWHPIDQSAGDVLRWRQWFLDHQYCQPFKQAHREVYLVTDAELETDVYSNRFAAHIVKQHPLAALCRQRGWRYRLQGEWDSWNSPVRQLPGSELQVEYHVSPVEGGEVTPHLVYMYLHTDQVRFFRKSNDGGRELIPVRDIPAKVFSECMRDVDLFVGVTSVGNDPDWQDQGNPELNSYWQHYAFGDLSETSKTRKEMLLQLIPQLNIASQCSFEGNFLIVRGSFRTYKIHLGSGNILMEPNDQYLCIVRKSNVGAKIFLPFDGDPTLSLILSKAMLLADDHQITDPVICNQIKLSAAD